MQSNLNKSEKSRFSTRYINNVIAAEISRLTRYFDQFIQWLPRQEDTGVLFESIECQNKRVVGSDEEFPKLQNEISNRTAILINGVFNHHYDIESLLSGLKQNLSRTSRLVVVMYNPYLAWLYLLAKFLGFRKGPMPTTFITRTDFLNLLKLSGYTLVRTRFSVYVPARLWGVGDVLNRILPCIPLLRWLGFAYIATIRPVIPEKDEMPSLTCVIPARNEAGNIQEAIDRMPDLPAKIELIFVEGNSSDDTWEIIQQVVRDYKGDLSIKAFKQTGVGKADAVRLGFSHATGDILTILDADLTMPPELLPRFYYAYCHGLADFINGSRLVYPMEGEAMRFLNRLGNNFFARSLSWVLDIRLSDSLCGTKLLARHDYERMIAWRRDFGDFDPFGDFELLFPAAELGLDIVNIPIRYRARTYGETNISRFRHGLVLLKMTYVGFLKIKLGHVK
jgi:hypothetical protein